MAKKKLTINSDPSELFAEISNLEKEIQILKNSKSPEEYLTKIAEVDFKTTQEQVKLANATQKASEAIESLMDNTAKVKSLLDKNFNTIKENFEVDKVELLEKIKDLAKEKQDLAESIEGLTKVKEEKEKELTEEFDAVLAAKEKKLNEQLADAERVYRVKRSELGKKVIEEIVAKEGLKVVSAIEFRDVMEYKAKTEEEVEKAISDAVKKAETTLKTSNVFEVKELKSQHNLIIQLKDKDLEHANAKIADLEKQLEQVRLDSEKRAKEATDIVEAARGGAASLNFDQSGKK